MWWGCGRKGGSGAGGEGEVIRWCPLFVAAVLPSNLVFSFFLSLSQDEQGKNCTRGRITLIDMMVKGLGLVVVAAMVVVVLVSSSVLSRVGAGGARESDRAASQTRKQRTSRYGSRPD